MNKLTWKSIGAVFAGLVFTLVVTTLVDVVLHVTRVYPADQALDDKLAVLATSYRIVISVAGAYLTAKLSPGRASRDVLILGCVGTALGIFGAVATWNMGLGPRWYAVILAVLAIPQCWLGGWLFVRRHPMAATPTPSTP